MQKLSQYTVKLALGVLMFLIFGCQQDYTDIRFEKFESLLKAGVVEKVIVISDQGVAEIYLDQEKITNSPLFDGTEPGELLLVKGIQKEYFVAKYDEIRSENNLIDVPLLSFVERPTFSDFLSTYGLLLIILLGFLASCITFPLVIAAQKKKIKSLESQISMLRNQNSASRKK